MIASPSDLAEERQAAVEAINAWNALYTIAERVVLLPVTWETHVAPRSGIRPQEAINVQLVRTCDVLVGMFWTRLGTATGVAEAGTVEEIGQFVAAGKPTLLYFSSRPIDPNKIDLRQYKKLRNFKDAIYKKALTGSFSGVDELRQKLLRDLLHEVRELKGATL
jgi:nucleoside 2-deoxyribosyltransferase